MAFTHGVRVVENPTAARAAVQVETGLPVYVGTAPVNLGDVTSVNKPVLCSSLAEYVAKFGPVLDSDRWSDYTLMEAAKAHFTLYGVAPIVCINVLDPANVDHLNQLVTEPAVLDANGDAFVESYGSVTPLFGVIKSTVVVRYGGILRTLGTDYTVAFDDDGYLVISRKAGGAIPAAATIVVSCSYLDPSAIVADDIIGGYADGAYTGLEVVEQVYPKLKKVPGFILAPGWTGEPTVAAAATTKATLVNGAFRAMALTDLSSDPYEIATYADVAAWKSDNGYTDENQIALWPKVKFGDDVYHLSTHVACIANLTDQAHSNLPFASPSNKAIEALSMVLDDDTEVYLTEPQATALNAQGIMTARNTFGGWKTWGNQTGCYPTNTDVKDSFIPIRRMGNHLNNTLILTVESQVDEPGNRRLIDGVVLTVGILLNSWIAVGAMLPGSKCEFLSDDNPLADLLLGKYVFRITQAVPPPAQTIQFTVVYDTSLLVGI